jgi:NADH-quinone oxidoreductase subunit L
MIAVIAIAALGIFIAWLFYVKNPELPKRFVERFKTIFTVVHNKYFVDEFYDFVFVQGLFGLGRICKEFLDERIIDGAINGTAYLMDSAGNLIRRVQNGLVQGYAFAVILGAILVIGYLVTRMIP